MMKFLIAILISLQIFLFLDVMKYPEAYITTWKYQLQQDIQSGKAEAIEYYQSNYVDNGKELF